MIINYLNTLFMSTKTKVIIFGILDNSELAHFYLTNDSNYEVVAFTINEQYINKKTFKPLGSDIDYPLIPFEKITEIYNPTEYYLFAPLSGAKMNTNRQKIYEEGKQKGYEFISYVSSKATLFNNKIGENCFILENNTIQPFTTIGNNVVMWSGNHIGHHGKIDDHVFFTSHVVLSGHCHVKERAWFGVNSTIKDGVIIGESSLIAMGSVITKSTEDNSFYLGVPAKKQEKSSIEVM